METVKTPNRLLISQSRETEKRMETNHPSDLRAKGLSVLPYGGWLPVGSYPRSCDECAAGRHHRVKEGVCFCCRRMEP